MHPSQATVASPVGPDPLLHSATWYDAAARGSANGRITFSTILGQRVASATNSQTTIGMYVLHSAIVMVDGVKAADTKVLLTSVIKANLAAP